MKTLFVISVCMLCILAAFLSAFLSAFLATPVVANSEYIQDANELLWFDTEKFLIKGDIGGRPSFYIKISDILNMDKEEIIQVIALARMVEFLAWAELDPNELNKIEQYLIDSLVPDRFFMKAKK